MSINITIKNAVKRYGKTVVIPDLSLSIHEGEFFTLLGPSGCGKTTLLRMIAGFNSIEGGDFYFNDKRINELDPKKRNIGMVFQNYAIFPHLTVRKNVAFGLKYRDLSKDEIEQRTTEFLKLVKIEEYAERLPEQLSGGQQQRVALARALAIHPDVLLMDEPLSNLDAKLRVEMRTAIKDIQKNVGITTVYVTHDQEEAMAVSDRIAVMNHGEIQQIGSPAALYQRPANLFVATFIGHTNVLDGKLRCDAGGKSVLVANTRLSLDALEGSVKEADVKVSIRPEDFFIVEPSKGSMQATVRDSYFLGLNTNYRLILETGQEVEVIQQSSIDGIIPNGTKVSLAIQTERINIFTQDGITSLLHKEGQA